VHGSPGDHFLNTGTTEAFFQISWMIPDCNDKLNIIDNGKAIESEVALLFDVTFNLGICLIFS